jgi:hypothetical protein
VKKRKGMREREEKNNIKKIGTLCYNEWQEIAIIVAKMLV